MSRELTVLHVVFSLEPGGMENGVVNVANRAVAAGIRVDVCCLERRGAFADRLPQESRVTVLDKPPGKSLKSMWKLFRLIRQNRPDVLHTHDLGPLIYGSMSSFGGRLVPILHGEHCQLSPDEQMPRRLRQRRRLYRNCAGIHTVSHSLKTHLEGFDLGRDDILPITNGVDTERFRPQTKMPLRRKLNLPQDALVLGVVGRFVPHKRHADMLRVFEELAPKHPNLHLVLVGDGPEFEKVKARTSSKQVHLPGFVAETEQVYAAFDLLVVPSLLEGLSNAVLEAMACGVPVLAHTACGNSEAVVDGENGILADLATSDALHEAVAGSIADPAGLQIMGEAARQHALKNFSIDAMADGYVDLYRQIGGGH